VNDQLTVPDVLTAADSNNYAVLLDHMEHGFLANKKNYTYYPEKGNV
jgi:hypothetical protein